MGHLIGIGKMGAASVSELSGSVSTARSLQQFHSFAGQNLEAVRGGRVDKSKLEAGANLDQSKLEVAGDRDICVTVLNVDKLREAAGCIVASEKGGGISGWGVVAIISLITWATTATVISVMQSRTIDELQVIRAGSAAAQVPGEVYADGKAGQ